MPLLVAILPAIYLYIEFSQAAISSYSFSGITSPSGTHLARTLEVDTDFPTNGAATIDTLTSDGSTFGTPNIRTGIAGWSENPASGTSGTVNYGELNNAAYTAISTSDDSHITTQDPGFGDTAAFWTQYQIAETPANITQIDIELEGYQGGSPQAGRKAWLGIWVPDAPTPYWKVLEASQQTSDYTYSGTLTTNLEDYIDGSGNLNIIFYNEDQSDSLLIDYLNVDVTFSASVSPPAILAAVADDPNNGDRELSAGDTLTLIFDKATNSPLVATKVDIDGLINFPSSVDINAQTYDHILGADYTGAWSTTTFTNDTLTITVVDGTVVLSANDVDLTPGDAIAIIQDGANDLKDGTGTSDPSVSSKTVSGNWGLRPDDDITYASDATSNAKIFEVALLSEYHYNHAAPYKSRGDLTYVGYIPFSTYAIGRRPSDGYIIAGENNQTGTADELKLGWLNPEKNDSDGQAPDGDANATHARGVIGASGPGVDEFYRLVYTASGVLYGASNDNKLYRVYDSIQAVPAGTHGSATNLAGSPICTIQANAGDPAPLQLGLNGSADFAFNSEGKLFIISHDILYSVSHGPLVGGVITGPCTATAIGDTSLSEVSGLAYTKGGQMHVSTFLPTNRELSTVDPEDASTANISNFNPDQDIYDLGSVPKWTDIEIIKSDGGLDFTPGQNGVYTLTVSNEADIADPNLGGASGPIFVRDTLPTGITFVSASGTGWACDNVGQFFKCENPNDLAKGASLPPITLTVFVEDNAVAPNPPYEAPEPLVINTACVDSTTFEEFDVEDCDMEPTPVGIPQPTITKTPSDNIVNPGQGGLVYTLRLQNNRTATGTGITVNDPINNIPLDAYLENLRGITATNCGRPAEAAIKIKGTDLRGGENPAAANIDIDGTLVSVDIGDGNTNDQIATAIALAINTDGTHHAAANDNVVTVFHGTNGTISNGKLIDPSALEAAIDLVDSTDDDTEMVTTTFAFGTDVTNSSTATELIIDNVAITPYSRSAQECVIEYVVDVKGSVSGGTIIHNRADATAPTEGGTAVFAEADVTVSDTPIMSPIKVDDDVDNVVDPLQIVTYTLTIDNIGNLDGTEVNVDDTLDSNMENLNVISLTNCGTYTDVSTANPPVLDINGVDVTLANNCVIEFTTRVKGATTPGTVIPNTAYVSAAVEGGFPTNASSDDLVLGGAPSLDGTKVHDKGSKVPANEVVPSELVTYTLTVDNVGNVDGTGINIDDTLDSHFENLNVVSLTNCGTYADVSTANPPVLDINGADITSALNCVIVFEVTVKNTTPPGTIIPNIASASAAIEGGNGDPNIPSTDLQVPGSVAINTTKADNDVDNIVDPGQTVTYTLTLNNTGDVKLTGIHALDTMDSDLENLNVTSVVGCGSNYFDQSSINPPELDIRGAGGDPNKGLEVLSGGSCVVTFTSDVKADTPGFATIPNVATVTESQEGAPASSPTSDVLEVSMPSLSATKVDDDVDNLVDRSQVVTYTITINNTNVDSGDNPTAGTRPANGVDIYDAMDSDLEDLTVVGFTNCGGAKIDNSVTNPPVIDIDDLIIGTTNDCVIEVNAKVKATTPGGATIPNTVIYSGSDEGATGGAAASDVLTVPIVCGDSFLDNPPEQCDDGNNTAGDGCSDTCQMENCGDNVLQIFLSEQCDDGNNTAGDGCNASCQNEFCGDNIIQSSLGETCDDGNTVGGDGCSATCTIEGAPPVCGDGSIDPGEQCDDGNTVGGDGCSATCQSEFVPPPPPPPPGGCTGNCRSLPKKTACLEYDPNRDLEFTDLIAGNDAFQYIDVLKDSRIIKDKDYVLSGNDNHSTGKQQEYYRDGEWEFQPWRPVRRMEAVKAILVSNCIPVEDEIPIPIDGFRYRDLPVDVSPNNDLMHFAARVFYTAYKWGVVTPTDEALAYPFKDVNLAETLAIGLRASRSLTKQYTVIKTPWYGKYYEYAKDKGILFGINKDPEAKLLRDDFSKIIFRIMWYNGRDKVKVYAKKFSFLDDWNDNWRRQDDPFKYGQTVEQPEIKAPVPEVEKAPETKSPEEKVDIFKDIIEREEEIYRGVAPPESCLVHDPNRALTFSDVPFQHWANRFIEMLRITKIKNSGDYIVSGHGNPSTGNIEQYSSGEWEYRPHESVTMLELIKTALISNCIPIEKVIIPPEDNFQFRQLPRSTPKTDEFKYFAARVLYTAYNHELLKGDVYPFIPVSRFQALAILSRASNIVPSNYQPKPLPFSDTSDAAWYAPTLSYLYERGFIKGFSDGTFRGSEDLKRDELSKFVTLFMKFNQNPDIRKYGQWLDNFYKDY